MVQTSIGVFTVYLSELSLCCDPSEYFLRVVVVISRGKGMSVGDAMKKATQARKRQLCGILLYCCNNCFLFFSFGG